MHKMMAGRVTATKGAGRDGGGVCLSGFRLLAVVYTSTKQADTKQENKSNASEIVGLMWPALIVCAIIVNSSNSRAAKRTSRFIFCSYYTMRMCGEHNTHQWQQR